MFRDHRGDAILEWVVLGAIVVAVVGGVIYSVMQSLATKLNEVNVELGS